eukprot:gene5935-134_t
MRQIELFASMCKHNAECQAQISRRVPKDLLIVALTRTTWDEESPLADSVRAEGEERGAQEEATSAPPQ